MNPILKSTHFDCPENLHMESKFAKFQKLVLNLCSTLLWIVGGYKCLFTHVVGKLGNYRFSHSCLNLNTLTLTYKFCSNRRDTRLCYVLQVISWAWEFTKRVLKNKNIRHAHDSSLRFLILLGYGYSTIFYFQHHS